MLPMVVFDVAVVDPRGRSIGMTVMMRVAITRRGPSQTWHPSETHALESRLGKIVWTCAGPVRVASAI